MDFRPILAGFILVFISTPFISRYLLEKGIYGIDLHKKTKDKVPELAGITVFASVLLILFGYYISGIDLLFYPLIAVFLTGVLGIIDGFKPLSALQKIFSLYLIGVVVAWGLGFNDIVVALVIGFLFMSGVNFTNMLAGFNGLEIGTGAIASIGLAIVSHLTGALESFIISSVMAGALLGFLYYNRFPAKAFPGDVGTLIIGTALVSSILIGRLYIPGVIIFIPYVIDAGLKFVSVGVMTRESQKPTELKDGKLYVPEGSNLSLPRIFLRKQPMGERGVVHRVWMLEGVFSLLAVLSVVLL